MSVSANLPLPTEVDRLVRVPMEFDDYLELQERHRAEYVDGMAVVSPPPVWRHQRVARRLGNIIESALPTLLLVEASGVWTGERRSRIPDVVATTEPSDGSWVTSTPVLVGEILSPSTRREDTVRKAGEYQQAGIGQYWIVDLTHRTLTVLGNNGTGWDVLLELADDRRTGSVVVEGHGTVGLDLDVLLET